MILRQAIPAQDLAQRVAGASGRRHACRVRCGKAWGSEQRRTETHNGGGGVAIGGAGTILPLPAHSQPTQRSRPSARSISGRQRIADAAESPSSRPAPSPPAMNAGRFGLTGFGGLAGSRSRRSSPVGAGSDCQACCHIRARLILTAVFNSVSRVTSRRTTSLCLLLVAIGEGYPRRKEGTRCEKGMRI